MWIMNKSGYFSVVQHNDDASLLMIRARVLDDLVRAFPDDVDAIVELTTADYRYRITLPRDQVNEWMLQELDDVTYTSHAKEEMSAGKPGRISAYMKVWNILGDLQPGGPYGWNDGSKTRQEPLVFDDDFFLDDAVDEPQMGTIRFDRGDEATAMPNDTTGDYELVEINGELVELVAVEDCLECATYGVPVMMKADGSGWEHAFPDEDDADGDDEEISAVLSMSIDVDTKWVHTGFISVNTTTDTASMIDAVLQVKGNMTNDNDD